MAIHHILLIGGRGVVYLDAREEHLTPDEARVLARKLIEAAGEIEHPAVVSEWP
ncbi:hypothetical protein [Cryobacterium sp. CG_9.6]|uniref:hypothetical protein n=1 Tax=Cryobacterium sp. CG_9.6 TaxID=2760710 RepID=UPI0024743E96|nr:hypothetical protein [Cryobacterium sp. CG_9.6]MDH6237045.1 hypothetical protein [Cryobacterium sp. CG_9.6]